MTNNRLSKSRVAAIAILGLCLVAFVIFDGTTTTNDFDDRKVETRRLLKEEEEEQGVDEEESLATEAGIYSWAETNLVPLSESPDPVREQALFWHIPKVR